MFGSRNVENAEQTFDAMYYIIVSIGCGSQALSFSIQNKLFDHMCMYIKWRWEKGNSIKYSHRQNTALYH